MLERLTLPLHRAPLVWGAIAASVLAVLVGIIAAGGTYASALVIAGMLGAMAALALLRHLCIGVVLVLLAILPGQFIRFSLGTDPMGGSAMLLTDLLLVPLVGAWAMQKLMTRRLPKSDLTGPLLLFVGVALLSFLAGIPDVLMYTGGMAGKPLLVAFLYWGRYVLYALFFVVLLDVLSTIASTERLVTGLLWLGVLLALGGFIQLWFIPDFTSYAAAAGWDPHQDRLLSSFFDPNFMGTFFAMDICLAAALLLDPSRRLRAKLWISLAVAVIFVAFLLTYSRGALLGLAVGLVLIGLFRAPRAVAVGALAIALAIAAVPRFAQRITDGLSIDETGVKRITSWTKAVKLLPSSPMLGVGYNHLATVQDALGTVDEFDVNNRGGVENSLLTVAVTTGALGLGAYLWHLASLYILTIRTWRERRRSPAVRHLALGTAAALTAVLVASMTLNAMLYPFILLQLWALLAIVERRRQIDAIAK